MRWRGQRTSFALVSLGVLVLTGTSFAQSLTIPWDVLDEAGGTVASLNFRVQFSMGQPSPTGVSSSSSYSVRGGFVRVPFPILVGVEPMPQNVPTSIPSCFALRQNAPNPFNLSTHIDYELPRAAQVVLRIYDARGALVKTILDGQVPAGYHTAHWDATDDLGISVASGVYFARLAMEDYQRTAKLIVLR